MLGSGPGGSDCPKSGRFLGFRSVFRWPGSSTRRRRKIISAWLPPPGDLHLPENEVHLWRIPLDISTETSEKLAERLTADEAARASRFYFEEHRRRFIASHAALDEILSLYIPDSFGSGSGRSLRSFTRNPHGKPYLAGSDLRFNLAHSHELAVVAVTRNHEIGVDIEYVCQNREMDKIAHHFFSPCEREEFKSLPGNQKRRAFFDGWTRKEAFIKAIGEGFSHPLDHFDVNLKPGEPARLCRVGDDPDEAAHWMLESFRPGPDYAGAVALRAPDQRFRYFHFDLAEILPPID